jgi:cysteine--tRNA ligase
MSTGFEAVMGYLHMTEEIERLEELIDWCVKRVEEATHENK